MNKIWVLNKAFERVAVVEGYKSLMWCERLYEPGAVDIVLPLTDENKQIYQIGFFLWRVDKKDEASSTYLGAICRIEALEVKQSADENELIVGAIDARAILRQRVSDEQYFLRDKYLHEFIRGLVDKFFINRLDVRQIDCIRNFNADGPVIQGTYQSKFENIGEQIDALLQEQYFGVTATFSEKDKKILFDFCYGEDRTVYKNRLKWIAFSVQNQTLVSCETKEDNSKLATNCFVAGEEDEYKARIIVEAGNSRCAGLDRREIFVDASNIKDNPEWTGDEYKKVLQDRGKEELLKNKGSHEFSCEIESNGLCEYRKDYNLGDFVSILNGFGKMETGIVIEVIETDDENGTAVSPKIEVVDRFVPRVLSGIVIDEQGGREEKEFMTEQAGFGYNHLIVLEN